MKKEHEKFDSKYYTEIEEQLTKAKKERAKLLRKVKNGDVLSRQEAKKNKELANLIRELKEILKNKYNSKDIDMTELLNELAKNDTKAEDKKNILNGIINNFKEINSKLTKEYAKKYEIEIENIEDNDLNKVADKIKNDIDGLKKDIDEAKKKKENTNDLEAELNLSEKVLADLEKLIQDIINIEDAEKELNILITTDNESIKNNIVKKYSNIIIKNSSVKNEKNLDALHVKIEKELNELTKEKLEIINKVNNGEIISRKEAKRIKELSVLIKDLEDKLQTIALIESIPRLKQNLKDIADPFMLLKDSIIKEFVENITKFKTVNETDLSESELKDIDKTKKEIEEEIKELKTAIKVAERNKKNTKYLEKELEENENKLASIENYLNNKLNPDKIQEDLEKLANSTNDDEKEEIINKYTLIINNLEKEYYQKLGNIDTTSKDKENENLEEENNLEDNQSLAARTKEKLANLGTILNNNKKRIAKIGGIAILVTTIALCARQCSKDSKKESTKNLDSKTKTEQLNTNEDLFNESYATEYEAIKAQYNLSDNKAVDYVNRSHDIQDTGFYDDASIENIAEVVMAIDNKDLYTEGNANLAQSFNTSFNRIVDNYLFGTTNEEDIKKLDSLKHFAKEGTDMDNFLTKFGNLTQEIIKNPNDTQAKENMYGFIKIFATSLNGFTNEKDALTNSKDLNKAAQINDYMDWYVAYNSFVAPLYPTFVDENEFKKYEDLQLLMISALESPEFEQICGESRTLGGE